MTRVLAGRYRLERQLGKGGMGSVWLAEHLALRSWVAVKLIDPSIASSTEGTERFRREAQAAAALRSSHVVQVLDYGIDGDTPYLVMELLNGKSLGDCLQQEGKLSPERTLAIFTQVGRAIGRAHAAQVIHRDLKPDNIFLVQEDEQEIAKVLDFGIAKTTGSGTPSLETKSGVTMGTAYYMSPEQMTGKKTIDYRTDIWALGVIVCECLSGVRPFDGDTWAELVLNICAAPPPLPSAQGVRIPGFDAWFARATARDPDQRFSSAQEMMTVLRAVLSSSVGGTLAMSPDEYPEGVAPKTMAAPPPTGAQFTAQAPVHTVLEAPAPTTGGAVEVPSHPGVSRRPKRTGIWIALGAFFAVALAAALLALRFRSSDAESATLEAPSASPSPSPTPPAAPIAIAPEAAALDVAEKPARAPAQGKAVANPVAANPSPPPLTLPSLPTPALPRPATAPPAASTNAPRTRCHVDPFTGQIRVGAPANAASFPCKQNPFTGGYQRL